VAQQRRWSGFHGIRDYGNAAFFIDSVFIADPNGVNLDRIDSMKIDKDHNISINGIAYDHRIYLFSKDPVNLVSLKQVTDKYIKGDIYMPIYVLDDVFIVKDAASVKIDENFILKVNAINSDEFDSLDKNNSFKFTFIFIYTKTEANIARSKEIHIR
jgi:hypothetical protein